MAGKITIGSERCKGCGLCVEVCPTESIVISRKSNCLGYFFAEPVNSSCTGCGLCAVVCPDAAIEVMRDERRIADSERKPARASIKEES